MTCSIEVTSWLTVLWIVCPILALQIFHWVFVPLLNWLADWWLERKEKGLPHG